MTAFDTSVRFIPKFGFQIDFSGKKAALSVLIGFDLNERFAIQIKISRSVIDKTVLDFTVLSHKFCCVRR